MNVAFDQLRHDGAAGASVRRHLVRQLNALATVVPPQRRSPLVRQVRLTPESAGEKISVPVDIECVENAAHWVGGATSEARKPLP